VTTVFSSSRAEVLAALTCTLISGMGTSGSKDIGRMLSDTTPRTMSPSALISTATGRWRRKRSIEKEFYQLIETVTPNLRRNYHNLIFLICKNIIRKKRFPVRGVSAIVKQHGDGSNRLILLYRKTSGKIITPFLSYFPITSQQYREATPQKIIHLLDTLSLEG